jgi:putative endonuclease
VGELAALVLLLAKGYRVRHRNWRAPLGELDLVCERRGEVVFVEVKARRGDDFGGALGAVGSDKRRRVARVAASYLSRHGLWDRPCRFDVVTFERVRGFPGWRLRHIADAFRADLGRRL